jgi:hypothetical protein
MRQFDEHAVTAALAILISYSFMMSGNRRHYTRPETKKGCIISTNAPHQTMGDYLVSEFSGLGMVRISRAGKTPTCHHLHEPCVC